MNLIRFPSKPLFSPVLIAFVFAAGTLTAAEPAQQPAAEAAVPIISSDATVRKALQELDRRLDANPTLEKTLRQNLDHFAQAEFRKTHPDVDQLLNEQPGIDYALRIERHFLIHRYVVRRAHDPVLKSDVKALDEFLYDHSSLRDALEQNPSLITDAGFVGDHAALTDFFAEHPRLKSALSVESADSPAAGSAGVVANSSAEPSNAVDLWIAVQLPRVAKANWVSDDMAATFADTVATVLRAQGFKGRIGTLRPEDSAPSRASVLVVRLSDWKTREGIADCTFTASLRTSEGDRDLGYFSGDNMIVTADGKHQVSSDGLLGSAQEAMSNLMARLRATGLLASS